jgi:excisionase family DNA binding protein
MDEDRPDERVTITVSEAAARIGISRASAYEAARRGDLPGVLRVGRRYVVSRRALERALGNDEPAAA